MHKYQNLLVAVDFSNHSEQAAKRAKQLAETYSAKLTLVHVLEVPTYPFLEDVALTALPGSWNEELNEKLYQAATTRLERLAKELDIKSENCLILSGVPRIEVVNYAKEHQVDLIVLGRRGLSGLQRLIGSTADSILHDAACDVLAVKINEGD